jgi:hypothetical protein
MSEESECDERAEIAHKNMGVMIEEEESDIYHIMNNTQSGRNNNNKSINIYGDVLIMSSPEASPERDRESFSEDFPFTFVKKRRRSPSPDSSSEENMQMRKTMPNNIIKKLCEYFR